MMGMGMGPMSGDMGEPDDDIEKTAYLNQLRALIGKMDDLAAKLLGEAPKPEEPAEGEGGEEDINPEEPKADDYMAGDLEPKKKPEVEIDDDIREILQPKIKKPLPGTVTMMATSVRGKFPRKKA